ncbi:unnamed protein product [Dibothriocephalus latus]|uniref:Uncharacterized protein n=1 Tax=Dibothriocephalus latus TaxID=60516 RepID=A0A3P6TW38_DIBLA|nr:unnamed protein product [Dibothriocephalus latus]
MPTGCPQPEEVVSPCNTTLRQQKVTKVTYRAEDCSCKRTEHTSFLPCGCPAAAKIISSAPRCDPERSERIIETHRPEWRDNLRACVEVKQTLRIPVVCSPHVSYQLGKCINGTQLLKTRILTADVNSCRCLGSVKIRRISCACPPRRLIIGRCAPGASTALAVIFIRNWDERLGRCIVVDRYQKRLFCTCPVAREEASCKAGAVEIKKVSYELYADQYGCRRKEEVYRVRPQCRAQTREQRGECNHETCKQTSAVYARTYDPKTCQCVWALQGRRECSCCGCPKRSIKFQCFNNTVIYATVDYFIPKQSECNLECQRMRNVFKKHAACKGKKVLEKPTWSECDTSTCTQQLSGVVPVLEKCQCKYVKKVFAQRKCCCPSVKQEIEICRDGKRIREIRTLVLDNFECKQKVAYIPKDQGLIITQTTISPIWFRLTMKPQAAPFTNGCSCVACVASGPRFNFYCGFYDFHQNDGGNSELSRLNRVTSRMKRCCCAAPPQEPPRCLEDEHVLVYKTVKMDFLHGQCVPKTREEFVPVVCPPKDSFDNDQSSTQVGACDPNTCHRKVVEVNWHLSACKCVPNRQERLEPCCCMHIPKRVKQICHKDGSMTKVIRYSKLVGDKCLPEILTEQQPRSACPSVRIQPIGPCNQHTGRQPIEINRYELDHCHCRIVSTQRKDRIC